MRLHLRQGLLLAAGRHRNTRSCCLVVALVFLVHGGGDIRSTSRAGKELSRLTPRVIRGRAQHADAHQLRRQRSTSENVAIAGAALRCSQRRRRLFGGRATPLIRPASASSTASACRLRRRPCRPRRRPRNAGASRRDVRIRRRRRGRTRCSSPAAPREAGGGPALLERAMMLPVALQTAAQSRLSRMQATRCETSRSDRQASAQAVQVSTQLKHASMQRLMASEWAGFSGWERNMARTATADMASSFRLPAAKTPRAADWFRTLRIVA